MPINLNEAGPFRGWDGERPPLRGAPQQFRISDLGRHIGDIARRRLGEPHPSSNSEELRFGDNRGISVAIDGPKAGSYHNHVTVKGGGVLEFLKYEGGMQKDDALKWLENEFGWNIDTSKRIVSVHPYKDENGTVLCEKVKYDPKDYRWRRRDENGKYVWNLKGVVRKVLYNLPELSAHPLNEPVLIVEGEKDADNALRRLGVLATCNPDGGSKSKGGGKWREEFSEQFKGRYVCIIPDNDDVGFAHAEAIARSVARYAADVRIIKLPGLSDKGDLSDWIAAGGTKEKLFEIARDTPPTTLQPATHSELSVGASGQMPAVSLEDFWCHMEQHKFIYAPTGQLWPASSVDARISPIPTGPDDEISASIWISANKPVEQMVWAPGFPMIIRNRLMIEGGWIDRPGAACFNLYRPPMITGGDPAQAQIWIDHVRYVYPQEAEHIIHWLAHRVQRPHQKVNHALVLGGAPGIGKDSILEPAKHAIGAWNFKEVSPSQIMGQFNGYLKSVILRVSEARDLGEVDRFQFYEHMKTYTAAPPDVLRVNDKYVPHHPVINCTGVIITTNYKTDGIYLPGDDRRHFVAWSEATKDDEFFQHGYWDKLWGFYQNGGSEHVAAYLRQVDLTNFNPKTPPPKTPAFLAIADANKAPEEAEFADAFDRLKNPKTVTLADIVDATRGTELYWWVCDRKHRRAIPHRLEACGYVRVPNPDANDGLWKIDGKRQAVYAAKQLAPDSRLAEARERATGRPERPAGQCDQ